MRTKGGFTKSELEEELYDLRQALAKAEAALRDLNEAEAFRKSVLEASTIYADRLLAALREIIQHADGWHDGSLGLLRSHALMAATARAALPQDKEGTPKHFDPILDKPR